MTSTAMARTDTGAIARAPLQDTAPTDFVGLVAMGDHLVRTGFLPAHIKTGVQVAAIVMTGRELGMTPMRALRSLVLVKGKVTESADSMLARFKAAGGRAQFRTLDETQAVLWLRHPNGDEHEETFTLADAKRAGIAGEMYSKYPKPMLRSRAITAGLKSLGWEGGAGVYDPSELGADPVPEVGRAEKDVALTITVEQRAQLDQLSCSHVLTEAERSRLLAVTEKGTARRAIDWATATIAARRAAERAEDEAGPADDVTLEEVPA
jgi:hypothetical protein